MSADTNTRLLDLCAYIAAHADDSLPLTALAERAHLSPTHLQRTFKALIGVSPKQFQDACRLGRFKHDLKNGESVTEALHRCGFGSSSRLYEKLDAHLGMTPTQYRAGGAGLQISWACCDTPLGRVLIAATDRGLCFVQFGDSDAALVRQLASEFHAAELAPMNPAAQPQLAAWMDHLRQQLGQGSVAELPLDLQGTAFQVRIWRQLLSIPRGEVRSYSQLAAELGAPRATRAVASACARNRIAVLVPCHRVLRADGTLGGYRWGLERKRALLAAEAQAQRR